MVRKKRRSTPKRGESASAERATARYELKLYITGATPRSLGAIANIQAICELYLKGRYRLEVVDIYQRPALASRDQIVAVPTLIRVLPAPLRFMVGDLSGTEQVLHGLGIVARSS
jgi:circadian clock protein KaiB